MVHLLRITDISAANIPTAAPGLPPAEPEIWRSHAPDVHCMVVKNDQVVARCSLWWTSTPEVPEEKIGAVGHYAALDSSGALLLLEQAVGELKQTGCSLAVGPMDGNTWRRYRFVTQRGPEAPFFLEPDNPDDYPGHFTSSGFVSLAEYTSKLNTDLTRNDDRIERARQRLTNSGVVIRDFRTNEFEAELRRIYEVSTISFRQNYLYTALPEEQFVGQYLRIRERVRPELVMLAEHEGKPIGYVFGIPDWLQKSRGHALDTAILKTVAILPGKTYGGLGNVLVHEAQQRARDLGFVRVIHALMHSANNSRNLSGHYAETMRRYTLFSRRL